VRELSALLLAFFAAGCAASTAATAERDFERPEADQVPLLSLDVVVVAAGPPRIAEERFAVRGFDPPEPGKPLLLGAEEPELRGALVEAAKRHLEQVGFRVRLIHAGAAAATASTAAVATTTTATVGALPPPPPSGPRPELDPEVTLAAILAASSADGVLVLRAVPVDEFTLDLGEGRRVETTALGREQVKDYKPVRREGRLLIGQAFLYDRTSGLRLWTRQAPDYPDDGRLTPRHPFLQYGVVADPTQAGLTRAKINEEASRRFVATILRGFPAAKSGSAGARAHLASLDVERERRVQEFFDTSHWMLDLEVSLTAETSSLDLVFFDETLEPLGSSALTPFGAPRLTLRGTYISAGGFLFSLGIPAGYVPGGFGRTIYRDNPRPTVTAPEDHAAHLVVEELWWLGAEAQLGQLMLIADGWYLAPRGGAFTEFWSIGVAPAEIAPDTTHVRFGLIAGLDLWLEVASGRLVRLGADVRGGIDAAGGAVFGLGFGLGAGFLF
jgi:hypothetical protein